MPCFNYHTFNSHAWHWAYLSLYVYLLERKNLCLVVFSNGESHKKLHLFLSIFHVESLFKVYKKNKRIELIPYIIGQSYDVMDFIQYLIRKIYFSNDRI